MEIRPDRCFQVKSHYLGLINQNTPNQNKRIWKLKAPLKIKIFLLYLRRGVILTKDNLAKRNWLGNQQFVFLMKIKRYNIYFLIADSREWYGLRSMRSGAYQNLIICLVCSGAGSMEFLKNISHQYFWARQLCVGLFGYVEMQWCLITKKSFFLQVIYSTTHWLRTWAILQKFSLRDKLVAASHFFAQVAKDFFCPSTCTSRESHKYDNSFLSQQAIETSLKMFCDELVTETHQSSL